MLPLNNPSDRTKRQSGSFVKPCLCFVLFVLMCSLAQSQAYITSAGVRLGTELGLTIQQKIPGTNTIEGILSTNKFTWQVDVIFEHHRRLLGKRLEF